MSAGGESRAREDATIVSPATPGGTGAVSIVRLSGTRAFPIVARLTPLSPAGSPPRTLIRAEVRDAAGKVLDVALVACFPAPHSFTGEDVAELHLHGSPTVVDAVVRAACAAGAVPAEPGEFSRRAFQHGKMDLTQAEGLADLIAARTEAAAASALRQLRGGIGREIGPLRDALLEFLTALESAIDFGDEDDVPEAKTTQITERVDKITSSLEGLLRSYEAGRRFRDGATVAIAGVANVGKSRLLNRLAGEERAIVDEAPGTTRDYLQAEVVVAGIPVILVDTAGLRETGDPVERKGVLRSRDVIARADLVLFVLDGGRAVGEGDLEAYREVAGRPHLVAVNKSDLPAVATGEELGRPAGTGIARVSAKTGDGLDALLAAVARELVPGEGAVQAQAPLTRERHRLAVQRALEALARAKRSAEEGLPLEFPAADVREASRALAELLGEVAPEEILDAVFRRFCIGK
ncbi:MAG: tRNA modification GTPase TrmE [Deltaproteobacteria bacterium]|nr:tRNA modification GTPase TrmE [Deltaproteobacteria bacterium]